VKFTYCVHSRDGNRPFILPMGTPSPILLMEVYLLYIITVYMYIMNVRGYRPKSIPFADRKCIICNKFEDEFHFILECLYKVSIQN
jgi:hypothetical protein